MPLSVTSNCGAVLLELLICVFGVIYQVVKLKGERELVKRAYIEEKKKADR